jgi:HK97 family phage portal protein
MTTYNAKPKIMRNADGSWSIAHRVESIAQAKAVTSVVSRVSASAAGTYPISPWYGGAWIRLIAESYPGAWQQNVELASTRDLLRFPPIYTCITLIAGDIAKVRVKLTKRTAVRGRVVWLESEVPEDSPFLRVLRKPNHYQTRTQYWEQYIASKLINGNAYALKSREPGREMVVAKYVLDPSRVTPLVAEDGSVFYRLGQDQLAEVTTDDIVAPASEIIHDRMCCLWHPLVGVPPLYATALAGTQGINIANNSALFFGNGSRPSGILTTPMHIKMEDALELKASWESSYGGANAGKTAVLGDDMKYTPIAFPASESQLTEQAEAAALWVAMAFHVPPYKLGLRDPKFSNMVQANQDYYSQCLQILFEAAEQCLDQGLELPTNYRSEFDIEMLNRMDPISRADVAKAYVASSVWAPNDAREREDMPPVDGGDEPLSQQQYYPLSTLAEREPPSAKPATPATPPPPVDETNPPPPETEPAKSIDYQQMAEMLKRSDPTRLRVVNG